jgi:hypothetical protein
MLCDVIVLALCLLAASSYFFLSCKLNLFIECTFNKRGGGGGGGGPFVSKTKAHCINRCDWAEALATLTGIFCGALWQTARLS